MWTRRVVLALLCAVTSACGPSGDGAFIRVEVDLIPAAAQSLYVYPFVDAVLTTEQLQLPVADRPTLTFGLRFAQKVHGKLVLSIGALDDQGCLVAAADGALQVSDSDDVLPLAVPLIALSGTMLPCHAGNPALLGVTPAEISTAGLDRSGQPVTIQLRGWGLLPQATVTIGPNVQQGIAPVSALELDIPHPRTVQLPGPAPITVSLAGQPPASLSGLSVFMEPLAVAVTSPSLSAPLASILDVAVADFDGDGRQDLALLGSDGDIYRYDNAGAADTWTPRARLAIGILGFDSSTSGAVVAGDVNQDGAADLIVVSAKGGAVLLNNGNGSFAVTLRPDLSGQDVALGDLNQDGKLDLVRVDTAVTVYLNPGTGGYAATPDQSLPEGAAAVRLADLNGDGLPEIITVAQGGDLLVMLGGVSPLQVAYRSPLLRGCAFQSPGLAIADLDGDGLLDVAVNGTVGFLLGGRTSFTPGFVTGVAPCFGGQAVVAADLNRDGAVDLAWLVGGTLTVIENAGAATFAAGQASFVSLPSTTTKLSPLAPRHTPLLDLNADGVPDIVLGDGVLSRASH